MYTSTAYHEEYLYREACSKPALKTRLKVMIHRRLDVG